MKVLLTQDVKGLGKAGEVKEVKEGYGMNFLVGKGLAQVSTPAVMKQWEAKQRDLAAKEAARLEEIKAIKATLETVTLTMQRKVGANGALFGAVTKEEIADELHKRDLNVDKKELDIKHTIKATGAYEIDIKLGHGIHATLKLNVEAL